MCWSRNSKTLSWLGIMWGLLSLATLLTAFLSNVWLYTKEPTRFPNSDIFTTVTFKIGLWRICPTLKRTNATSRLVDELRKANLPNDPKAKCYLKCMMTQLQVMQEDGHLDIELLEASMPDVLKSHGGMETVHKCKHIENPDLCETAFQLLVCFKKENPGLASMF